jgi:hypothetical protein
MRLSLRPWLPNFFFHEDKNVSCVKLLHLYISPKKLQKKNVNRALTFENAPQVDALAAQIKELQDQANQLGEEGEVDESMKKMAEVEAIKVNKDIQQGKVVSKKGGKKKNK